MRKKLGSFFLGVFVFIGSVGLAAKSLLMNLASVSSSDFSMESSESQDVASSSPRRIYASSEDKKVPLQVKNKL
jgi:hypothetical protein